MKWKDFPLQILKIQIPYTSHMCCLFLSLLFPLKNCTGPVWVHIEMLKELTDNYLNYSISLFYVWGQWYCVCRVT